MSEEEKFWSYLKEDQAAIMYLIERRNVQLLIRFVEYHKWLLDRISKERT